MKKPQSDAETDKSRGGKDLSRRERQHAEGGGGGRGANATTGDPDHSRRTSARINKCVTAHSEQQIRSALAKQRLATEDPMSAPQLCQLAASSSTGSERGSSTRPKIPRALLAARVQHWKTRERAIALHSPPSPQSLPASRRRGIPGTAAAIRVDVRERCGGVVLPARTRVGPHKSGVKRIRNTLARARARARAREEERITNLPQKRRPRVAHWIRILSSLYREG